MTKDLSRQLCELIPIEPKRYYKEAETDLYTRAKRLNAKIYWDNDKESYYIELYPSFKTPENFVSLYELPLKLSRTENLAEYIDYVGNVFSIREIFIENVIALFDENYENYDEDVCEKLNQALQSQDWKY